MRILRNEDNGSGLATTKLNHRLPEQCIGETLPILPEWLPFQPTSLYEALECGATSRQWEETDPKLTKSLTKPSLVGTDDSVKLTRDKTLTELSAQCLTEQVPRFLVILHCPIQCRLIMRHHLEDDNLRNAHPEIQTRRRLHQGQSVTMGEVEVIMNHTGVDDDVPGIERGVLRLHGVLVSPT